MITLQRTHGLNLTSIPIQNIDQDNNNNCATAEDEKVWSLAYEELKLPIFPTPSWYFSIFDHFVVLSVRWSFFNRYIYEFMSDENDEEYAKLMLD